jgi:hypothetical protein
MMKKLFGAFIGMLFLICCTNTADHKPSVSINTNSIYVPYEEKFKRNFDTIVNVGQSIFRVFIDTGDTRLEKQFKIQKRFKNSWKDNLNLEWTSLHTFKDWNKDGYMDIVLQYHHAYVVLLFNPKKQKFVEFGDIGELTDEVMDIAGTNLKYNFTEHKHWYSELFDIDPNYNMRSYGLMMNSEVEIDTAFIDVYKRLIIYNDEYRKKETDFSFIRNEKLVERIDPQKQVFFKANFEKYDSLKIVFIKNYWAKNWRNFVK